MDDKPDLIVMPHSNLFLFSVGDGRSGNKVLKFVVKNAGEGTADYHSSRKTGVQLTYGTYATHRDDITKKLRKNEWDTVEFPLPKKEYFDPDCEFEITIDIDKNLDPSNRDNNFASGVISEKMKKYILPDEEDPNNKSRRSDVENVLLKVRMEDDSSPVKFKPIVDFKLGRETFHGRPLNQNEDISEYTIPPEVVGKPYTIEIAILEKSAECNPNDPAIDPNRKSSRQKQTQGTLR